LPDHLVSQMIFYKGFNIQCHILLIATYMLHEYPPKGGGYTKLVPVLDLTRGILMFPETPYPHIPSVIQATAARCAWAGMLV